MAEPGLERTLQSHPGTSLVAAAAEASRQAAAAHVPEQWNENTASLAEYLWIIGRHRWRILAFIAVSVAATLIISSRMTPVYESTAAIDIDRRMPTGILGQDAAQPGINDADQFLATQVKLVQSDAVLRPVADHFNLRAAEGKPDGERAANAPVALWNLTVKRPVNTYLVLISYRSADSQLAADVANAIAQSYIEHTYNIRYRSSASLSAFMERQLGELKAKMERSSSALAQFERELGVIRPEEKTNILSARLLQLNAEYTTAETDRVRKEAAFLSVRNGTLEAAQVSSQGEALKRMSERVDDAQARFADVRVHYGSNHPEYRKAAAQLAESQRLLDSARANIARRVEADYRQAMARETMLRKTVADTKGEFDRLNMHSFEYQSLQREAEADKKLYEELVRKIKEAGINAGFQNSAIRIADTARPGLKPVFPNIPLNAGLAFIFSTLLAVGAAVMSDALDKTIRDPEQVARTLKSEVIGSLPMVKPWRGRMALVAANGDGRGEAGGELLPARSRTPLEHAYSSYDEAIRTLRNSILLADFERNLRSVLITSAAPAEGKSTVAANLAYAHAQQGHRTLLIDADLRRPSLHRRFEAPASQGLSTVLLSEAPWRDAVLQLEHSHGLCLLAAGPPSRRAADLLGKGLMRILDEAIMEYDLVLVDAPPLLGFPEPLQMATLVDGVIVVARAGETDRKAVGSVISTLHRLRANVLGVVLNQIHQGLSESYRYYGYYGKYYRGSEREAS